MVYRILHFINAWYAIAVLWMFVLAFALAFSMMFVFPQVTILLLFLGLFGLGFVVVFAKLLGWTECTIARHSIASGVCPHCRLRLGDTIDAGGVRVCEHCHTAFLPSGREPDVSPTHAGGATVD